jgi:hypothetical protein
MELSGVIAANDALENEVINRSKTLISQNEYCTNQFKQLQERINQQSDENTEIRLAADQHQNVLKIESAKFQIEKQNLEFYINRLRGNQ